LCSPSQDEVEEKEIAMNRVKKSAVQTPKAKVKPPVKKGCCCAGGSKPGRGKEKSMPAPKSAGDAA